MMIHCSLFSLAMCLGSSALAAPIPVANQGFESPAQVPGGWTSDPPTSTTGWPNINANYGGVFYPRIAQEGYTAPFGNQVLFCNGAAFEQTVSANVQPDRTYTLRVAVVHRPGYFNTFYGVQLFAGTILVAHANGTVVPPPGGSQDVVVEYTSPYSGPTIGLPIVVRLYGTEQANFDNVRLDESAPVPCPGDLNGNGATGIGDFSILASNFGAGPGATPAQGDITGDGFVDIADFNIFAANFGCQGLIPPPPP